MADSLLSYRYSEGRRVGLTGLPIELVPGIPGTREHDEALRGWRSGAAHYVAPTCTITTEPDPQNTLENA